jgi:threonine dehydrogenase-like Zn-dependent dehydrogenase
MKKLIMTGPKKSKLIDVEIPELTAKNQVLIKLKYCGVCMSEHYNWSRATEGQTFGHEPVGEVVKVGDGVKSLKVGDRVSGLFAGNAEYVIGDESNTFKIPDNLSDEDATLEPLACLMSAVSKARLYMIGEKVAVVGCGYMGCGAISLLKLRGAYVVGVDIRRESLEDAKRCGADEVYTPDELPEHYFYRVGGGLNFEGEPGGFSMVMEWGETNESLDLAINMTRMCGQLCIGAYHTGEKRLVDVQQLNVKAIDCLSTHPREVEMSVIGCKRSAEMLSKGTWNFKGLPTKIYPITMFDKAQEELETKYGKYMKALVCFDKGDFEPYIINC